MAMMGGIPQAPSFGGGMKTSDSLGLSSNRQLPRPAGPVMGPGAKMNTNLIQSRGGGGFNRLGRFGGNSSGPVGTRRFPGEGGDKFGPHTMPATTMAHVT